MIEQKSLSKKDLVIAYWRWILFSNCNYNYERLMATAVVFSFKNVFKKLYGDNKVEYKAALKRHMQFFNTEPHFGSIIHGIVLAMEEQRAQGKPVTDEAINGIKTGLMGPFAGIGDTLWQGTLTPILLAFGLSMGSQGNLMGPLVYSVLMACIMFPIGYMCFMKGYGLGREGIEKVLGGNQIKKVITGASCMGAVVLGALAAQFVSVSCPQTIQMGALSMGMQKEVFDKLFLGILPLGATLLTLYMLKNRQMKPTLVTGIMVLVGMVGGVFWIL